MKDKSTSSAPIATPSKLETDAFSGELPLDQQSWQFVSPRAELAPCHELQAKTLTITGNDDPHAIGCWSTPVTLQPNQWYRAGVEVEWERLEAPHLSLFAQVAGHFLVPSGTENSAGATANRWPSHLTLSRTFFNGLAPLSPRESVMELYLKAAASGGVKYSRPTLQPIAPPVQRKVRVATVRFGDGIVSHAQQIERIQEKLELAGKLQADIVCLPEFAPLCGVESSYWDNLPHYAEAVPTGPVCKVLSALAGKHNIYVLAGILESRGRHIFNTAVLFDRQGMFAGQYDKTHLTLHELRKGVSCGSEYPVFDLDFGRIAVHICYDEWFPEVARLYAHLGAEVLFLPVAGGKSITWRTRALDNRIYFVAASITPPSMIIDSSGAIIAQTHGDGIAVAELDLDDRQTNYYGDPTLADAVPCIAPQMRHRLDESLLKKLHHAMLPQQDHPRR